MRREVKEKTKDSTPKPVCHRCYCRFCVCGVDTSKHFQPTDKELEEWYGQA